MQIGPAHYVQKWFQGVDASPTEQGRSLTHGVRLAPAGDSRTGCTPLHATRIAPGAVSDQSRLLACRRRR